MTELKPGETINLRCEHCGHLRTPILDPFDPGIIYVICHECMRRWQAERPVVFAPHPVVHGPETPDSWARRFFP